MNCNICRVYLKQVVFLHKKFIDKTVEHEAVKEVEGSC